MSTPSFPQYSSDSRYPPPTTYACPPQITGIPTQAELDAYPRMFTWGELKDIIMNGDLVNLMRNKQMQERYDIWSKGIKSQYGSTENYLNSARLPWKFPADGGASDGKPTYPESQLHTPNRPEKEEKEETGKSKVKHGLPPHLNIQATQGISGTSTPGSGLGSGLSTPSSAGFVSLDSLKDSLEKLKRKRSKGKVRGRKSSLELNGVDPSNQQATENEDGEAEKLDEDNEEIPIPDYLRFDPSKGLDDERYAVLPNDWPYNVPYGVQHFCVWSRVPIAHPHLVDYNADHWAHIESEGLGGFTGTLPIPSKYLGPTNLTSKDSRFAQSFGQTAMPKTPIDLKTATPLPQTSPSSSSSPAHAEASTTQRSSTDADRPTDSGKIEDTSDASLIEVEKLKDSHGRGAVSGSGVSAKGVAAHEWFFVDTHFGGPEMKRWAGVTYESVGGQEVGGMVRGLWDPRGWECLWFVNPPRLQSVPGFSHFHVFARRKTPEEVDASEAFWGKGERPINYQ